MTTDTKGLIVRLDPFVHGLGKAIARELFGELDAQQTTIKHLSNAAAKATFEANASQKEYVEQMNKAVRCATELLHVKAERDQALARLSELSKQEPIGYAYEYQDYIGSVIGEKGEWAPNEVPLYLAAGASQCEPVIDFEPIMDYATANKVNYNQLCTVIRAAINTKKDFK